MPPRPEFALCRLIVVVTVSIRSTKRLPSALWGPKEIRRHSTAHRSPLSLSLLVGSTPSTSMKLPSAGQAAMGF